MVSCDLSQSLRRFWGRWSDSGVRRALVTMMFIAVTAGVVEAHAAKIEDLKVLSGHNHVKLVFRGDGVESCKIFKFENPLRLALDFEDATVADEIFPKVVASAPVLQILRQPFATEDERTRIEVVLSEDAAYEVVARDGVMTLDLRAHYQTVQVDSLDDVEADDAPIVMLEEAKALESHVSEQFSAQDVPFEDTDLISGPEILEREQAEGSADPDDLGFEAADAGFDEEDSGPQVPLAAEETTDGVSPQFQTGAAFGGGTGEESADWGTYLQGEEAAAIGGVRRYTGEPITLRLRDADIQDVLQNIASITGFNIVLDPGVTGTVTIFLQDVPWDQALDIILRNNGLGRAIEGNVMRVAPLERLRQEERELAELQELRRETATLYSEVIFISYADAEELAVILRPSLTDRGGIIVDDRTNSFILTDVRESAERIKRYIKILDRRTRQVSINARIVNATKTFTRNLGLSYGFRYFGTAAYGTQTGLAFPYNYSVASAVNLPGASVPQVMTMNFGDVLDSTFLNMALHAAESEGTGKVIANPKIITSNNEEANIRSGVEVPYILAQGDIQVPTGGGGAVDAGATQLIQFQSAEVALDVTPQVTNDDFVDLELSVTNNSLGSGTPPSINTQSATAKVLIKDGDTFVLGGFKQINMNNSEDRIPGIHKVPVLGWFFKARAKTQSLSDLLIFVTPSILASEGGSIVSATAERSSGVEEEGEGE